jgi:hypothetical protein
VLGKTLGRLAQPFSLPQMRGTKQNRRSLTILQETDGCLYC